MQYLNGSPGWKFGQQTILSNLMFEYVIVDFCWCDCPEFSAITSLPAKKRAQVNHIPHFFIRLTDENYNNYRKRNRKEMLYRLFPN